MSDLLLLAEGELCGLDLLQLLLRQKVKSCLRKECMGLEKGFCCVDGWVATLCKEDEHVENTSRRSNMLSTWFSTLECLVCRQMTKDWACL